MKNNRIRILHVAQAAGGVERYLQMLFKYMNNDLFENILVCSHDYCIEDIRDYVTSYEQIDMFRSISIRDIVAVRNVRMLIKKYNPDIVYAHSSKAGVIARVANIGFKNICIYNPHGWAFNMRGAVVKQKVYAVIERIAALFCNKIVCISEAEKQSALHNHICKEDKLQVIYNGIDIEEYEQCEHKAVSKTELGIPENAFVIGMVGRICEQKAPDIFIRMANYIVDKIPNVHFLMVGNGEMEDGIVTYAEENGFSDKLHITGWVNDPLNYVRLFDVACLLSRWEGFGLVLPEYMLVGKPIVASCVDAIPNIIKDGMNGLLVNVDDAYGAGDAVMRLYENSEIRNKCIINGYETVRKSFDVKRTSNEHEMIFDELFTIYKRG